MSYLRGFAPWIVYAAVSSASWQWAAIAGLLLGVRVVALSHRAGMAADALILEVSTIGYFVVLTGVAFATPHSGLHSYDGALSFGWLALTAWATIGVGRPFTLGIARRNAPPQLWDTPQFLRVNTIITTVWAAAFTVTAAVVAVCEETHSPTLVRIGCQVVGFLIPATFTRWYPRALQARQAAAPAQS